MNDGALSYATADVGYDFLVGTGYKIGAFTGYNYYADKNRSNTVACKSQTNLLAFALAAGFPTSVLIGTQDSQWNSWRLGLAGETELFSGFKVSGDVAYLPYTSFTGRDNHLLRE